MTSTEELLQRGNLNTSVTKREKGERSGGRDRQARTVVVQFSHIRVTQRRMDKTKRTGVANDQGEYGVETVESSTGAEPPAGPQEGHKWKPEEERNRCPLT